MNKDLKNYLRSLSYFSISVALMLIGLLCLFIENNNYCESIQSCNFPDDPPQATHSLASWIKPIEAVGTADSSNTGSGFLQLL